MKKAEYRLYILRCNNGAFYTGIAKNLEQRLKVHEMGKGSKYVRAHLPFKLVYSEGHPDKPSASKREAEIKAWSRAQKVKFISTQPKWTNKKAVSFAN